MDRLEHEVWLSWTSGASEAWVNCRSQLATVRAVGQSRQPAEASDQRIAGEIAQMLQPARAGVEQRQHEQGKPAPAVVAAGRSHTRRAADAADRTAAGSGEAARSRCTRSALRSTNSTCSFPLTGRRKLATFNRIRAASCVGGVTLACSPLRAHKEDFLFTDFYVFLTRSYFRIGANSNGRKDRDGNSGSTLRRLWRVVGGNVMGDGLRWHSTREPR